MPHSLISYIFNSFYGAEIGQRAVLGDGITRVNKTDDSPCSHTT